MPRSESPLKAELDRRGIRHTWMARQLGVSKFTFSRIEAGVQPAPPDWYARAAAALGVPEDFLRPREGLAA